MTALLVLALALAADPAAAAATAAPPAAEQAPAPEPAPSEPPTTFADRGARRYQVEKIELRGLEHTHASEVRRHVLVAEGDLLDPERVSLSRLRLLQLGWFSRVESRVEKGSARGLVVVVFQVQERNTLVITDLVFGSTPAQSFYGGLGLSQQNFLGRGLGLSGAFAYGGSPQGRPQDPARFALRSGFFAPDVSLFGRRAVLGANAWFLRGEEFACPDAGCAGYPELADAPRLRYQRLGGELSGGLRAGAFERLLAGYRYERVRGKAVLPSPLASVTTRPAQLLPGWSDVSALSLTYELDTRDDFFFPTEGHRVLAQITFASRLLGSDYEYSKYLLQAESSFGLLGIPLRFQSALGAVQGGAPFFDRFYAADWSYFAVGPALGRAMDLNFSTDPRYDAFLAMGGLEYAVPLFSGSGFFRRGYLALGARGVFTTETLGGARTRSSRSPVSCDVALRLDTPVGDFNASLGYALDNVL
ncbi:MAG: BamA/TamA family outer membrane protein [Anaeromyxobacteraceae bacterium]